MSPKALKGTGDHSQTSGMSASRPSSSTQVQHKSRKPYKRYNHANKSKPIPKVSDSEQARQKIDKEIANLEQRFQSQLRMLRAKRNEHAPIAKVPAELLCKIFFQCQTFDFWSPRLSFNGWISVTWVCQYWREVALGSANLWSNPLLTSLDWTKEMLERSKGTSLSVTASVDHFNPSYYLFGTPGSTWTINNKRVQAARLCLQQLHRVRELVFPRPPEKKTFDDHLMPLLSSPAPALERLELHLPDSTVLPDGFLAGQTPQLTILKLTHCALPFNSPLLSSNLTHLNMGSTTSVTGCGAESFPILLDALQRMAPSLSELELRGDCLPQSVSPALSAIPSPSRKISLSSLSKLRLFGNLRDSLNVAFHLTLPSTTTYWLDSYTQRNNNINGTYRDVLPLVTSVCSKPVRRLELTTSGHDTSMTGCFFTQLWLHQPDSNTKEKPSLLDPPSFFIGQDMAYLGGVSRVTAVRTYWEHMNLSRLCELELDVSIEPKLWLDVFGNLTQLNSIGVFHDAPRTLIKALKQDAQRLPSASKKKGRKGKGKGKQGETSASSASGASDAPIVPAFPALRKLSVTCFDFATPSSFTADGRHHSLSEDLLFAVRRRYQLPPGDRKYQLHVLKIEQCELTYADPIEGCRDFVKEFDFDEYFGEDLDSDEDERMDEYFDEDGYLYDSDFDGPWDDGWY